MIAEVGPGQSRLTLGTELRVEFVVLGFDEFACADDIWQPHSRRLKSEVKYVRAKDDPEHMRLKRHASD